MILGQSAATAAAMAMDEKIPVQKVAYSKLRERLLADGQILEYGSSTAGGPSIDSKTLNGIVVDESQAQSKGNWRPSTSGELKRVGKTFLHDNNSNKGESAITYTPDLPEGGNYEIVVLFPPHGNRSTNVPVSVRVNDKTVTLRINQKEQGSVSIGTYPLPKGKKTSVTISNNGTQGYVVADAVQFIPRK